MEFGSDFNAVNYPKGDGIPLRYKQYVSYFSGRLALLDLCRNFHYERIWIPSYYCGQSLEILNEYPIKIERYNCIPTDNPTSVISKMPLRSSDLLLRMNYFGWYLFQDNDNIPCDVIEDHTHSPFGPWAMNSNASWCFASLRKTFPIADGGILWSPQAKNLPNQSSLHPTIENVLNRRYNAMQMKTEYLSIGKEQKEKFLPIFRETEGIFDMAIMSDISIPSKEIILGLNLEAWFESKNSNYYELVSRLRLRNSYVVEPEKRINCVKPFSLVLMFSTNEAKENARRWLIDHQVYPAVLWPDVWKDDQRAVDFSHRMLSIHCDARYSTQDMGELADLLNKVI